MRKIKFQTNNYYHIYNRGVEKRKIFMDEKDFVRFLISMKEFNHVEPIGSLLELNQSRKKAIKKTKETKFPNNFKAENSALKLFGNLVSTILVPLVEIVCYCLNQNHFHILIKPLQDKGIEKFMHKLSLGYSKYFNSRYNRSGSLFQGTYQSVYIKTEDKLRKVSCYINGNPEIHKITANAEDWIYSSYQDYLGLRDGKMCDKNIILKDFKNIEEYKKLVDVIIKESGDIKDEEKKYFLEYK